MSGEGKGRDAGHLTQTHPPTHPPGLLKHKDFKLKSEFPQIRLKKLQSEMFWTSQNLSGGTQMGATATGLSLGSLLQGCQQWQLMRGCCDVDGAFWHKVFSIHS